MAEDTNRYDLLIIGSGIYGIQAARTYLELHPIHRIIILEADSCPGGVWSANRTYNALYVTPEFNVLEQKASCFNAQILVQLFKNYTDFLPSSYTQSPLKIWEFSDQPLTSVSSNETYHQYFQARHFTQYLKEYLDNHVYEGATLRDRITLHARVEKLWKEGGAWMAKTEKGDVYTASKVIDASGQTSIPNIPNIPGKEVFKGGVVHHKAFGESAIMRTCKKIVVLGGGKSAADVAYASAKEGLEVHWVIRKSGNGPAAYFPPDSPISYYAESNSMFHQRFMASLIASVFSARGWWTSFLYNTFIGQVLLRFIWKNLNAELLSRANYDREDGKENGFANLKPDGTLFWENDSSGVNQRPDFFETIATKVKVYRQDIEHIGVHEVYLSDGMKIETDVIVLATGWKDESPYIDPKTAYKLGLATSMDGIDEQEEKKWRVLEEKADEDVMGRFPILGDPPPHYKHERSETPFRLYMAILPIRDRSIAFLGKMVLANHTYNAEVQALFAVTALDGAVLLPSEAKMEEEVAMVRAWMKRRYPAKGQGGNWYYFDVLPYTDMVLEKLGLGSHRTNGLGGLFKPMAASNLSRILDEYRGLRSEESKKVR